MSNPETTLPATVRLRGAIASALTLVCSDGNSDVRRVVDDVIACIEHAGFSIVENQHELLPFPRAKAIALLREALLSDYLTPYVESRIRAALQALEDQPHAE